MYSRIDVPVGTQVYSYSVGSRFSSTHRLC